MQNTCSIQKPGFLWPAILFAGTLCIFLGIFYGYPIFRSNGNTLVVLLSLAWIGYVLVRMTNCRKLLKLLKKMD